MNSTVYDPSLENYFERCLTLFTHLKPLAHVTPSLRPHEVYPALMMVRGRLSPGQIPAYSRFIAKVSKNHPSMLAEAIRLAALGYHFEKFTRHQQLFQAFKDFLEAELTLFREAVSRPGTNGDSCDSRRQALLARVDSTWTVDQPVLHYQAGHTAELVGVVRHQRCLQEPGVRGDQKIVVPDWATDALQLTAYLAVMTIGLFLKREDVDPFQHGLQLRIQACGALPGCTVAQLTGNDDTDSKLAARHRRKTLRERATRFLYHHGDDIGIEQVAHRRHG